MVFKKKKLNDVATAPTKKEELPTPPSPEEQEVQINLLDANGAIRDHIYNNRIINELTAIRAVLEEILKVAKE